MCEFLNIYDMDKSECTIVKVFTVKESSGHTYYVQRMPSMNDFGLRFVVMKDRRRLFSVDFKTAKQAISWLLEYLTKQLDQLELPL